MVRFYVMSKCLTGAFWLQMVMCSNFKLLVLCQTALLMLRETTAERTCSLVACTIHVWTADMGLSSQWGFQGMA